MKPGYKTSEFYVTIFTALGSIAVAFGVLSQAEASELAAAVGQVAAAVIALIGAVLPVVAYVKGRASVKSSAEFAKES